MGTPKESLSDFTQTFTSDGSGQSLIVDHDNRKIPPWRITFLSFGTYVLNYAAKDHPTDAAGRQDTIPADVGVVSFAPAIEIDATTAPGLHIMCEY
jgi:hypothetical protein